MPQKPSFTVAIGASAGGLSALEAFFDHMPSDSGMAFVIIQHLSPDFKSLMDDLLARHTEMAIHRVTSGIELEADSIYLIPPKTRMTVAEGRLHLKEVGQGPPSDLPIDVFFSSLAADVGDRAMAVSTPTQNCWGAYRWCGSGQRAMAAVFVYGPAGLPGMGLIPGR